MRTTSLLGLILFPTVIGCGAGESSLGTEHLGTRASAVQDGKSDTVASHNFAVGIASSAGAVCSGTLIAPNLVLTARHCVVPIDPKASEAVTCADKFPTKNASPSTLYVTTSTKLFSRTANFYQVAEITTPTETSFCGNDIALLTLEDNIPSSEAEPATPVVQFKMTDSTKIGRKIAALGYGITSPSAQDSGTRRIHEDIGIECVPDDTSYSCKGLYRSDSDNEFITEGYVCSGDSGSGAFEQESFTKGAPYVLGALSRGPQTADTCLAAIYSRTDAHADLIIDTAKKAQTRGGYEAPAWIAPPGETDDATDPGTDTACEGDTCTDSNGTEPGDPGAAGATTVTKKVTTGCSATPGRTSSGEGFGLLALAAAVVVASRRRRSA